VVQTKAGIIGLILLNDFGLSAAQSLLLLGVEEYCSSAGYYLRFARHRYPANVPASKLRIPPVLQIQGLADCLILAGTIHENCVQIFEQHGRHYVALGNHLTNPVLPHSGMPVVQYDDDAGFYEATGYLAQLGHEHIWYIGDASRPWHRTRFRGYSRAMSALGLEPHIHTIALSDEEFENGQAAVSHILEQGWPMTAIVAASDELAYGAREGLRQGRREVPKDVSLIGFENGSGRARGSNLTSVSVDMVEVGRQLARAAIARIEHRTSEESSIAIPARLIKRSTCRPLRKEDQMIL
jgi:DNA-binding LacI/PurR family transcriptional regulator